MYYRQGTFWHVPARIELRDRSAFEAEIAAYYAVY
jgi:hypothetical protein